MKLRPKIFRDVNSDIVERFDTSDYPTNHPSRIKTALNTKVLGMFKDEACGSRLLNLLI